MNKKNRNLHHLQVSILFIALLAVLSVILRLFFLSKSGYDFDLSQFVKWGNAISQGGFWSVYSDKNVSLVDNYPPLIPLISSSWFYLGQFLHLLPVLPIKLFFKILPTLFEVILVTISTIYIFRSNIKYKKILLTFAIVSPALALVTSAWGQADAVFTLFILLAFIFADKKQFLATFLIFLSLLSKPQAVPAILVYFGFLLFKKGFKNFIGQAALFFALFLAVEGAFRVFGSISLFSLLLGSLGFYKNISLNAFNIWWLLHGSLSWGIMDNGPQVLNFKNTGLILLAVFETPAIIYLFLKAKKLPEILLVVAYSYLVFFVFPTEIHERYLYPAVALLAIPAILNKRILIAYIALSVTHFLNVFAVLQSVYPQFGSFIFKSGNLLNADWTRAVALINLIVTIYIAIYFIDESAKK